MRSFLYSALILLPVLVWSQKCPKFQSVIPLEPTATPLNLSYALVASGKFYLIRSKDQNLKKFSPNGVMPKGFEESRLITVVDKSSCNESQYYLIAIQSFGSSDGSVQIKYSTLDLKNWYPKTQWSEPRLISEHSLFANDPYLQMFNELDPNFEIEDFIRTIFYWDRTHSYLVVTKPLKKESVSPLRYYAIDAQNTCDQNYSYSKRSESLSLALNRVVEPLDLCFFSHFTTLSDPLLYCLGGTSFQVNSVVDHFKNGSIRTEIIGVPETLPTIDRLRVLGSICNEEMPTTEAEEKDVIRVRINEINIGVVPNEEIAETKKGFIPFEKDFVTKTSPEINGELTGDSDQSKDRTINGQMSGPMSGAVKPMFDFAKAVSSTATPSEGDSSSTFIIVFICLAIFVVIMIGILIIAARRQQQMAKM